MQIIRCTVNSNSADDKYHRVKISADGVFSNLLADTSNGLYLRTGDIVYVAVDNDYLQPLVLGRCSGQLELQDLVDTINNMVEVFNKHQHNTDAMVTFFNAITTTLSVLEGLGCVDLMAAVNAFKLANATSSPTTTQSKITPNDLLY